MTKKKVCLIVLDGWGHGSKDNSDAVFMAKTPFMDALERDFPSAELRTDGEHVGLPDGQMGNSEVGHMNIGAGRVVFQDLVKINNAVKDGSFAKHPVLLNAMQNAKEGKALHFMGLLSDGGVHSTQAHLHALCDLAVEQGVERVYIHAFTDGRDTDPKGGKQYLSELLDHISGTPVQLASVIGRYYAMDRDKRWERVKKAYDLLINGIGRASSDILESMDQCYAEGLTDEFIEPIAMTNKSEQPLGVIQEGDVVVCFNFRTDRCREITEVLTQNDAPDFEMKKLNLEYFTMTKYDEAFKGVHVVYEKDDLSNTLGEAVSNAGRTQIRIAETEKYPHVTFFFSGGREVPFEGETRMMVSSPKVPTYDLQPEMSAPEIAENISKAMRGENQADFICLNFANPDMVGHTGVFTAIVKAVEATDGCLKQVVEAGMPNGYSFIIIADHGNADMAVNKDGSPNTAHTTNPVPVVLISEGVASIHNGILADVAPTVLDLLQIEKPIEMTGSSLVN
ncbi:MAG: 2,3-bisphosphoglycerate-independent phosphoglycerate mutase [Flavobacteriales bacterium]|jgi:2,3-bisphosphoglycerate-independent phosphoglycerate mutase